MSKKIRELIILLVILGIAAFFRLWQLDKIPPGLYPDVAMNGNDAIETLRTGNFRVFYPDNNGREGLFIWLIALSFSLFGVSIWSIKIVSAITGILTVFGLYLLTKELFRMINNEYGNIVALLASFFLATSFWHINFSRIGFRAILLPLILVSGFYFLFRGFRHGSTGSPQVNSTGSPQVKKILNFIFSGIFFGLGFYAYTSYRFIVLLVPLVFFCWFLIYQREKKIKMFLLVTGYWLMVTLIVALPLGLYFLKNPQDFFGRAIQVSIFAQKNPLLSLGKSLIFHLGMFNFYGDPNWRHNFAGYPMLFWFVGILFLIGIIFSIKKLIFSIKVKDSSSFTVYCSLLAWFFIMLLPGILSAEGIPHGLRTIGVIPVACIFAGIGGKAFYEIFNYNTGKRKLLILAVILFLLAVGISEFSKYFFVWGKHPAVKDAFTQRYADIGYYLNSLPPETKKYVIVNELGSPLYGISIPGQTPMFIEAAKFGKPRSIYLKAEELDKIEVGRKRTVIIPLYDGRLTEELQKKFPQGAIEKREGFNVYEVK